MRLILIILLFQLSSCYNKVPKQEAKEIGININNQEVKLIEKIIDNKYTQIILSECNEIGEHEFTETNTIYFDINSREIEKHTFVFASQIDCKMSGGTCGYSIQIFQNVEKNQYKNIYGNCARELIRLNQIQKGYYLFTIILRDGEEYTISYNGEKFEEKYTSFRGISFKQADLMAKKLDTSIEYFFRTDENYNYKKLKIGNSNTVDFYKTKMGFENYFMFDNEELIFHDEDIIEFEVIESKKKYFDIKVLKSENLIMTKDTAYYKPIIFMYSNKERKYKIKDISRK